MFRLLMVAFGFVQMSSILLSNCLRVQSQASIWCIKTFDVWTENALGLIRELSG